MIVVAALRQNRFWYAYTMIHIQTAFTLTIFSLYSVRDAGGCVVLNTAYLRCPFDFFPGNDRPFLTHDRLFMSCGTLAEEQGVASADQFASLHLQPVPVSTI